MARKVSIYGLLDPRDMGLRYIGKTKNPKLRLTHHLTNKARDLPCSFWVEGLKRLSIQPTMVILETVDERDASKTEQFYIQYYKMLGAQLTNVTHYSAKDGAKRRVRV